MGPGTLYGVLTRLEKEKLIQLQVDDGSARPFAHGYRTDGIEEECCRPGHGEDGAILSGEEKKMES